MERSAALDTVLQPNGRAMATAAAKCGARSQVPLAANGPMRFHSATVPPHNCRTELPASLALSVEPVTRQASIQRSCSAVVPAAKQPPTMITRQTSLTNFGVPAAKVDIKPQATVVSQAVNADTAPAPTARGRSEVKVVTPVATAVPRVTSRQPSCGGVRRQMSQPVLTRNAVPPVPRLAPHSFVVQGGWKPGASAQLPVASHGYRTAPMMCSMRVPFPCNGAGSAPCSCRGPWTGSAPSALSVAAEIDRRYPVTPLVHDIVEEALQEAPDAFQAPELRRDLKPRLRAVILEALQTPGTTNARLQNPNDRVILGVTLHNAEAWSHFARAARRQCAQNGLGRDLSVRLLEAVRRFLGLDRLPEDSPERLWDMPPDKPLHPIDDLAPLLCSQSTWQQEELPGRHGLMQEPVTTASGEAFVGYPSTSPSSTLDFAWLLPAGQSPSSAELKDKTMEALIQLPGVRARASDGINGDGIAAANFPASHRSPEPKSRRAGPYDHIQAKIDTNLPESAKSSPRSSRSPSRQRTTSSSPRVSKLMLPTGSRPGSPRSPRSARSMNSRGSADSRRRSGSNGPKSQPSELEDPREASLKLRTTQYRQPAPWRN